MRHHEELVQVVCVINSWNLAVSQCYQPCPVGPISLDSEYPLVSNKSSVVRYPLSVCLSPNSSILYSFLMAALQLSLSFSIGLCHASLNVLGSVCPDVTAQVSWIQSSMVNSGLSMDSFLGENISWA